MNIHIYYYSLDVFSWSDLAEVPRPPLMDHDELHGGGYANDSGSQQRFGRWNTGMEVSFTLYIHTVLTMHNYV